MLPYICTSNNAKHKTYKIMLESVKILKTLNGEFVTAQAVKEATQKEYNQSIWEQTVDRYNKYSDVRFFKTEGTIYPFNYYAIYTADGIRFLNEIHYGCSITNGGFAYGFITEGCKNAEAVAKLKELDYEVYKNFDKDSLTILRHTDGRIATTEKARQYMRKETDALKSRFFTKCFNINLTKRFVKEPL